MSSYDLHPTIRIHSGEIPERGYERVVARIREELAARTTARVTDGTDVGAAGPVVLALECYPGTDLDELRRAPRASRSSRTTTRSLPSRCSAASRTASPTTACSA